LDGLATHSRFVHKILIDYLRKYEIGTGLIMDQWISSPAESPRSTQGFPEVVRKRRQTNFIYEHNFATRDSSQQ
jgi:hypothetical protein